MIQASGMDAFQSIYPEAVPFLTYTSGEEKYDILDPQGYANKKLTDTATGKDLFFKDTIAGLTTATAAAAPVIAAGAGAALAGKAVKAGLNRAAKAVKDTKKRAQVKAKELKSRKKTITKKGGTKLKL